MKEIILYLLAIMIFYDFSVHVIYLLKFEKFFLKRKINYWPEWGGKKYQIFWSIYYGIALALLLIYLLL